MYNIFTKIITTRKCVTSSVVPINNHLEYIREHVRLDSIETSFALLTLQVSLKNNYSQKYWKMSNTEAHCEP